MIYDSWWYISSVSNPFIEIIITQKTISCHIRSILGEGFDWYFRIDPTIWKCSLSRTTISTMWTREQLKIILSNLIIWIIFGAAEQSDPVKENIINDVHVHGHVHVKIPPLMFHLTHQFTGQTRQARLWRHQKLLQFAWHSLVICYLCDDINVDQKSGNGNVQ